MSSLFQFPPWQFFLLWLLVREGQTAFPEPAYGTVSSDETLYASKQSSTTTTANARSSPNIILKDSNLGPSSIFENFAEAVTTPASTNASRRNDNLIHDSIEMIAPRISSSASVNEFDRSRMRKLYLRNDENSQYSNMNRTAPLSGSSIPLNFVTETAETTESIGTGHDKPKISSSPKKFDSCEQSWEAWRSRVTSYRSNLLNWATPTPLTDTSTIYSRKMPCSSSTCGVCYASPVWNAFSVTTISETVYGMDDPRINPLVFPKPTCNLSPESCERMQADFRISQLAYSASLVGRLRQDESVAYPIRVPCETRCQIVATHKATLFYFAAPVTKTNRFKKNLCTDYSKATSVLQDLKPDAPDNNGVTPPVTAPTPTVSYDEVRTGSPIIHEGYTFYPGNIYLYLPYAELRTPGPAATIRQVLNETMLTMGSSQLQSIRYDNALVTPGMVSSYPVNYNDFISPIPWSAYKGAIRECEMTHASNTLWRSLASRCSSATIVESEFHPVFIIPSFFLEGKSCMAVMSVTDPPTALDTVSSLSTTKRIGGDQPPRREHPKASQPTKTSDRGDVSKGLGPLPAQTATQPSSTPTTTVPNDMSGPGGTVARLSPDGGRDMDPKTKIQSGDAATIVSGAASIIGVDGPPIAKPGDTTTVIDTSGAASNIGVNGPPAAKPGDITTAIDTSDSTTKINPDRTSITINEQGKGVAIDTQTTAKLIVVTTIICPPGNFTRILNTTATLSPVHSKPSVGVISLPRLKDTELGKQSSDSVPLSPSGVSARTITTHGGFEGATKTASAKPTRSEGHIVRLMMLRGSRFWLPVLIVMISVCL